MSPDSSPTPTPVKQGLPLFKGGIKKKKVLFPAGLQASSKKERREPAGLPMFRQTGAGRGTLIDRVIERFMRFKMSDLMLISAGVAVLLVAPLAERLIMDLAEGGRAGMSRDGKALLGSPFGGTLLEMLVNGTVDRLRRLRGKGGGGGDGMDGVYGETAGENGSLSGAGRAWWDAVSPAEAAALAAARKARLPKPSDELAGRLNGLAPMAKPADSGAFAASMLASLSSSNLVKKKPDVESNLSRMTAPKDYRGMDRGAGTQGLEKPKLIRTGDLARATSGGHSSADIAGGSVLTNSGNTVDPQIQKLHDINAKWQKIIDADNAVIAGLQSSINSAPDTWALLTPMKALDPAYLKLEADQAKHLAEIGEWTSFVQTRLPGSPNGLNDATTKSVMRSVMNGRGMAHNASRAGGHAHHRMAPGERQRAGTGGGRGPAPQHHGKAGGK
ncbi:MAG: hypothetical protein WC728_04400 [Elusimicrobiota bacterium]